MTEFMGVFFMFFDAHSDIISDITNRRLRGETDILSRHHLPRLRRGGCEGSIFAMWSYAPYGERLQAMMDCAALEFSQCEDVAVVHNTDELERAKSAGKFYIFLGIEGMAAIGTDIDEIDRLYAFGLRHGMLTWNEENTLGAGASSGCNKGLTDCGKAAVRRMQALHMLVDVSHLNAAGFYDICDMTQAPIIASHSNASALCNVPRNLTDDQLKCLARTGGVVGLNAYHNFVHPEDKQQTVEQLALHAAHIADLVGIDHVGCGFDFCEFLEDEQGRLPTERSNPYGLEDASQVPNFFRCLKDLGMHDDELQKIAYGNFHRVIREILG